ncbi:MAG: cyclase family protein [Acidobacteria bacterium]|nr:cyclase family protein [Acidobacteriota bacterium]
MRNHTIWLVLLVSGVCAGEKIDSAKAMDLTYTFDEKTIYWPTSPGFHWEKTQWGKTPAGYFYSSANYGANEHGGTHLDSPIHFSEGGISTEQIPVSKLIAAAVVVDVSAACGRNADYRLTVADLQAFEQKHGRIPNGSVLLVRTGWGRFWPDKMRYLGTDKQGDVANLHFPGVSKEAAEFLVKQRALNGLGIDTASIDHGQSKDFIVHRVLYGAGLYGLENVANLEKVPVTGATLIALPMKIKGGTGGPARIVAILP